MIDYSVPIYYIPDGGLVGDEKNIHLWCLSCYAVDSEREDLWYYLPRFIVGNDEGECQEEVEEGVFFVVPHERIQRNIEKERKDESNMDSGWERAVSKIEFCAGEGKGTWVIGLYQIWETEEMKDAFCGIEKMGSPHMIIERYDPDESENERKGLWRQYIEVPNNGGDEDWCGYMVVPNLVEYQEDLNMLIRGLDCCGYGAYPTIIHRLDGTHLYLFVFSAWHA